MSTESQMLDEYAERIERLEAVVKLAAEALSSVQDNEATVGQIDAALEACYAALKESA